MPELCLMPGAGLEPALPFRAAAFKAADFANLSTRAAPMLVVPALRGRRGPLQGSVPDFIAARPLRHNQP